MLLNKAVALSYSTTIQQALQLIETKEVKEKLQSYYLYFATKADFYIRLKQFKNAGEQLKTAIKLTKIRTEKLLLTNRLQFCLSQFQ